MFNFRTLAAALMAAVSMVYVWRHLKKALHSSPFDHDEIVLKKYGWGRER